MQTQRQFILALFLLAMIFVCTLLIPLQLYAWSPLILGIPHVLADLYFLVVLPGIWKKYRYLCVLVILLIIYGFTRNPVWAVAGILWTILSSQGEIKIKTALFLLSGLVMWCALEYPRQLTYIFVHLHNIFTILCWWTWSRKRTFFDWTFLCSLIFFSIILFLMAPGFIPDTTLAGQTISQIADNLTPGLSTDYAQKFFMLFVALQAVHYMALLYLIPMNIGKNTLSNKQYFFLTVICLVGCTFLLMLAQANPWQVRIDYLILASFHGWMECAILANILLEGPLELRMA